MDRDNRSPAERYGDALEVSADAKSAAFKADKLSRRVFAQCLITAEGKSAGERDANARLNPKYIAMEDELIKAETDANLARAKADAAQARFEEWRSMRADARSVTR